MIERHKNGGGRVLALGVEIDQRSFLDRESCVDGQADVWESQLFASKVAGEAIAHASILLRSTVRGDGKVVGAFVKDSDVSGGSVRGSLSDSPSPLLIGCKVRDHAYIGGSAHLVGVTAERNMVIEHGKWVIPPRYVHFDIKDNGIVTIGITESTDGHAYIGCRRKPMTSWIRKQNLWQKVGHWTDAMRDQIRLTFEEWLDTPTLRGV